MRTTYGCFLPERLFETFSPTSPEEDIRLAVSKWLPLLTVEGVVVEERWEPTVYGQQDRVLHVHVDYLTPTKEQLRSYVAVSSKGASE